MSDKSDNSGYVKEWECDQTRLTHVLQVCKSTNGILIAEDIREGNSMPTVLELETPRAKFLQRTLNTLLPTPAVTTNPTECPSCGAVGADYDNEQNTFSCPDTTCGVDTFHRGETIESQPDQENYDRGADGRVPKFNSKSEPLESLTTREDGVLPLRYPEQNAGGE